MALAANQDSAMEVDSEEAREPLVYQKDESEDEIDEVVEDIDLADPK